MRLYLLLPLLSFPCGICALWAVGDGSYGLALLATFTGGMCLYFGTEVPKKRTRRRTR